MPSWRQSWKIPLAVASAAIFVLALKLMQAGARGVAPLVQESFEVETPLGALGFGWALAYVLLSGSPVAATALAFFDAREIDATAAFAMVTGSRLGAAFVVLLLGFVYVLYRRDPIRDLRIGLLALIVTASIYLPAFALGYGVLEAGLLGNLGESTSDLGEALEGGPVGEVTETAEENLPSWGVFLLGLALIMASFKLFDLCLPSMDPEGQAASPLRRYVYSRWPMFALGGAITLVSMSVTVSLGLLVPLHDRRIVRPAHVVPYIMGANITTFVDTLLAAMTLGRSGAITLVMVEIGAVTAVSLLIMASVYERYERAMLAAVDLVVARRRNLAAFVAAVVAIPLALLLLPRVAG